MNFKNILINNDKTTFELKYNNEKIFLYKSTFKNNRTRYYFIKEKASNEFVRCVLENINLVGIEIDMQSKKYFIDVEDEPELEPTFTELGYRPHTDFCELYFKSYRLFN